jgi:coproporphyrinogen III oxidase-like Fe-S oxidoreductase
MTEPFPPKICPYCGMASDVPHEAQVGCIEALQSEITVTRQRLRRGAGTPEALGRPRKDAQSS